MARLAPKEFPYSYNENGSQQNVIVKTQVDTAPSTGGPPQADISVKTEPASNGTLVGTYVPQTDLITPIINPNTGFPVASSGLTEALVNDQNLKLAVGNSVLDAASESLGSNNLFPSKETDRILGNTASTSLGTADLPPPQGGAPGSPGNPMSIPVQPFRPTQPEASSGSGLRYPLNKGDAEDSIMFEARQYDAKADQNLGPTQGMCILSIQPSISDSNTVGWGDGRVNALQFEVYNAARNAIGTGFQNAATRAGERLSELLGGKQQGFNLEAFQVYAAGQAAQINDVFTRETGQILNPNLELLFQGPELRTFNFTFQLSARSLPEAKNIKKIIRFFKKNMAVTKGASDIFLKSPNVFKITYSQKESLNKFKPCALRSFNVDYTPLGTYMTFEDGTMVSYQLSMQFQELFPILADEDYMSETEIGY